MKKAKQILFVFLALFLAVSAHAYANSLPVDIPGTGVHFFTLRYEGEPPFQLRDAVWNRLSIVLQEWVTESRDPAALQPDHVTIAETDTGELAVFLKDHLIVAVDDYHVQVNRATAAELAERWSANLKTGIEVFVQRNALTGH